MQPVIIWGEVLFAIDFSMDFCALYFSMRLLGKRIVLIRLLLGAALCASVGVFLAAIHLKAWMKMLLMLASAIAACMIVLCRGRIHRSKPSVQTAKELLNAVLLFIFLEVAAGGLMTVFFSSMNRYFLHAGWSVQNQGSRYRLFWICAAGLTVIFSMVNQILKRHNEKSLWDETRKLYVRCKDAETTIPCFCDSGNLVKEPISGLPVIVLPDGCMDVLQIDGDTLSAGSYPHSRLVSVRTVSQTQLYWAIHPSMLILYRDESDPADTEAHAYPAEQNIDAYIIFSPNTENKAIVPASLLQ